MTEEEKKAIGMCRLLLNGEITLHIIDDDGGTAYAGTVNKTYNDDLETVLNLIQKQQEEIEDCKKCVIREDVHNYIEQIEQLEIDKQKLIEKLEEDAKKAEVEIIRVDENMQTIRIEEKDITINKRKYAQEILAFMKGEKED